MLHRNEHILLVSNNLWYFGEGMLGPLFAVFSERIGGDILDISAGWSVYLLVMGIATIATGKLCDRLLPKEPVMILGYAINALASFGYLAVHSPFHLLLVQAGIGLGTALADPPWYSLYSKYENESESTYTWGLARGQAHIVTAVAILIGGVTVKTWGFQALFIAMGCIQTVATLYQATILIKKKDLDS